VEERGGIKTVTLKPLKVVFKYNPPIFTKDLVEKYKSKIKIKIKKLTSKIKLINYNDYYHEKWERLRDPLSIKQTEYRHTNLKHLIKQIIIENNLCTDINPLYIDDSITFINHKYTEKGKEINTNQTIDILLCIDDDADGKIKGFIVIEKGACKTRPHSWCVNLICAESGFGPILMGCLLYCIKKSGENKLVLLELSRGYPNLAGFFSYTKLGFNRDDSLSCFDKENLPMSVNLDYYTVDTIISYVNGVKRPNLSDLEDPTGIYNKYRDKSIPLSEKEKSEQQKLVEKFQEELENPSPSSCAIMFKPKNKKSQQKKSQQKKSQRKKSQRKKSQRKKSQQKKSIDKRKVKIKKSKKM